MWNQWSASLPPMPPPTTTNQQQPLIGPVLPQQAPPSDPPPPAGPPAVQAPAYAPPSGAPTYTPAQYAAMTAEQQYAVQQHWQQWQAYEQQYAQWHAQYGEQYKREMAAIHAAPPPGTSQYNTAPAQTPYANSFAYPPPAVSNPYQVPPAPAHVPPPPPPDDNSNAMGIKAPPQIYEQPPPPPPPPQQEEKMQNQNAPPAQFQGVPPVQGGNGQTQYRQNQDNGQWSQPPPPMQNQGNRWGDLGSMGGQQERQQQNVAGATHNQVNRWNDGSLDGQQQGQFNQQFNNNNNRGNQQLQNQMRDQQRDDLNRNRQSNEFRGRTRGRGGNKRQQQSESSEERNNRQQQQWQQTDGPGQRNNRGNFNNRFDNYDNYDRIMEQGSGQQGPSSWNNSNQGNNFSPVDNQRQQQNIQNQNAPVGNTQNNMKTSSGVDEKAFDEQFRLWEEQFENWKKENANHPDRTMYMQYEREFEKTRIRLLERREQMRRRKMIELQKSMPQQLQQQPPQQIQQLLPNQEQKLQDDLPDQESEHEVEESKEEDNVLVLRHGERSDMEQSENEESNPVISGKQIDPTADLQITGTSKKVETADTNIFRSKEITGLFKTAGAIPGLDGGIPGLDLVGSKEGENNPNLAKDVHDTEVIDLDNDGPSRPAKLPATPSNIASLLPLTVQQTTKKLSMPDPGACQQAAFMSSQSQQRKIPSLFDIVVEKPTLSPELECRNKSPDRAASPAASKSSKVDIEPDSVENRSRSISKDRDVLASPSQRPLSQLSSMSQRQQVVQNNPERSNEPPTNQPFSNEQSHESLSLHPQAADLAKALQDPNVMQLLTVALAQAQQAGGINSGGNAQQNQLLQQLQQLQPLLQMHQDRNSNNQSWNNSQSQRPQPWLDQNLNINANKGNSNPNQNRNSWGGNPFNRNDQLTSNRGDQLPLNRIDQLPFNRSDQLPFNRNDQLPLSRNDQLSLNRGPGSGNDSDGNIDMQQRNPHNPFRRSFGGGLGNGRADNSSGGKNFDRNVDGLGGNNPFNMNNGMGLFGDTFNAQQQRGGNMNTIGGRFDNNRPLSNFGNSLGFRNNTNNFGDRGSDDKDYYRPAQVFDYQNRSRADTMVPPAKVVDYGHRPSTDLPTNSFNRDNSEFVPVKTIDYGHASNSAQNQKQFEQKKSNFKNQTSRWNQDQQGNQDQFRGPIQAQSREQKLNNDASEILQNKSGCPQNAQQQKLSPSEVNKQIKKTIDDGDEKQNSLVENEDVTELDDENQTQYPNNKWILQNPESRQRPGPPTKRGKRNPSRFRVEHQESPQQNANSECDEIEENFEEISDTEEINEMPDTPLKSKSKHLFPSVSNSIANAPVVFPSMENNNTIPIDEILFKPGRLTRPKNIVVIIRGPPGSGKSHVAKLIKDKEVEMGGPTPRLLSIDDYFMIENDYEEKCPKTGRKIPKKEIIYEYEKEMEDTYMQYLIKSFKKTITDHLFDFIIVDCCNQSLRTFNEFYNAARDGNFSPFVVDMICDLEVCLEQNIHSRKEEDIKNIIKNYQECPGHYIKLDVSNLLENVVEMEDVSDLEDNFVADCEVIDLEEEEEEAIENDGGGFLKSKWDTDPTTENLARLDGTSKPMSKRGTSTLEEYLQIDGWEPPCSSTDGKKRVRWADIEEKRAQDKMRAIGFVVGQTDWNRMMDPTSGSGALTKTKYIERLNKRR